jgi:T-complex protein 1 subunit eta
LLLSLGTFPIFGATFDEIKFKIEHSNRALLALLGPRGMDKLIHDGRSVTISNDGATLIGLLDIVHPAAKTLVDIA